MTLRFPNVALSTLFVGSLLAPALVSGCGSSTEADEPPLTAPVDAGDEDVSVGDATAGDSDAPAADDVQLQIDTAPSGCTAGQACGDGGGGVCTTGGVCCDRALACAGVCCATGNVCSFGKCALPGVVCVDATDCKTDEICDYALGPAPTSGGDAGVDAATTDGGGPSCTGGADLKKGRCLPRPPRCAGEPPPGEPTCLAKCEYRPPIGAFSPTMKFSWGSATATSTRDSVMMTPVVIQLDDDNCDGFVDEKDIPEIVFSTFTGGNYNYAATLHAISIIAGKVVEKWTVPPAATDAVWPGGMLAAGNVDGKPGNEIIGCTREGASPYVYKVRAYDAAGKPVWTSPVVSYCRVPNIADLDGDGVPEVIVESGILNGATGALLKALNNTTEITVADVTGDGSPDLVSPIKIWDATGALIADATLVTVDGGGLPGGSYVAIGDFDKDGKPEIVNADPARHMLHVWRYDPGPASKVKVIRRNVDINGPLSPSLCPVGSAGNTRGGGPPTVADFNGDGTPDVAMAGGVGYGVYDGKKLLDPTVTDPTLWIKQTQDCSSASTGSSIFDFDGDGKPEVVYSDEHYLRIYSGTDGTVLFKSCNTTGTLQEYPLVADVDNDGRADIVVASNSYSGIVCPDGNTKQAGIRIFGDNEGKWVRTRRIWNQHTYHVTNVNEDGSIPKVETLNWTQPRLNNFRQNVQPLGEFAAPDLVVTIRPGCEGVYALVARVRNLGEAAVEPDVVVGFYGGATKLGTRKTTRTLYPGESEDLILEFGGAPPAGVVDGTTLVHAVVDDGMPPHAWKECRTDNNKSAEVSGKCAGPK